MIITFNTKNKDAKGNVIMKAEDHGKLVREYGEEKKDYLACAALENFFHWLSWYTEK